MPYHPASGGFVRGDDDGSSTSAMNRARLLAANPAAVAMMVGATQHKAESAAKTEKQAADAAASQAKVSIDLGADGKQVINAKGVPVDDFDSNIAKAYEGPQRELSSIMDRLASNLNREKIRQQLQTYQGRLAAARELGANALTSRIDAWRIGSGRISPESAVDQVAMQRAAKLANFHRMASGVFDDARLAANTDRADRAAQNTAARQRRQSLLSAINKSDLSNLSVDNIAAEAGLSPEELTPQDLTAIKARRDSLTLREAKDRRGRVAKTINDLDPDALTPDNVARLSGAEQLTESEIASVSARKKALDDKRARDEARDARADAREARAVAAELRAAQASERSAHADERAGRSEERSVAREEHSRRQKAIDELADKIEKNNDRIQRNSIDYAKALDDKEREELRKQNIGHIQENKDLLAHLNALRSQRQPASAPSDGKAIEYVSPAEWKALIASGETAASLAKQGIRRKN